MRQRPDLAGAHEALLADVLARVVSRTLGLPQGPGGRRGLLLSHARATIRNANRRVRPFIWPSTR
jgi:hypothetical protein